MASMLFKKRDGGPNVKFYESSETLLEFDSIRQWLLKNSKKVSAAAAAAAARGSLHCR